MNIQNSPFEMLFLIGHDNFEGNDYFIKHEDTLVLDRNIIGSERMSTKIQVSKNEMKIQYKEDCGYVEMKNCLLNGKQKRRHCKINHGDELCLNKVPYFRVILLRPKYFGEALYSEWNWQKVSKLKECEFITQENCKLLKLVALRAEKPIISISQLRETFNIPNRAVNMEKYITSTNGRDFNNFYKKNRPEISTIDLDRINLLEVVFVGVNLSEFEIEVMDALAEVFDSTHVLCIDQNKQIIEIKQKYYGRTIVIVSNVELQNLNAYTFETVYNHIISNTIEELEAKNAMKKRSQPTYQQGTDFMAFFLSNKASNYNNTDLQTQTYSSSEDGDLPKLNETTSVIMNMTQSPKNPTQSQLLSSLSQPQSHSNHRSFIESQRAFTQSLLKNRQNNSQKSSLSQTFGITPEEIKRRLQKRKDLDQSLESVSKKSKFEAEETQIVLEASPVKHCGVSIERILSDTEIVIETQESISHPDQPKSIFISGKKALSSANPGQNVKIIPMSRFNLVERMKFPSNVKILPYSDQSLVVFKG
eukprot:NODE_4_length_77007_cov_1.156642.p11 type:complete len:532 gc:universal NODE_4_length_77007_cov_1.156642:50280-48685(-)